MRVLIVQSAFVGDIILATPVIEAVKERHPDAEIYFLTTALGRELLQYDSRIAQILVFDKRKKHAGIIGLFKFSAELRKIGFSTVYSIHKSWRTSLLLFLSRIPTRIGFAHSKLSYLYTHKIVQPLGTHAVIRNLSIVADRIKDLYPIRLIAPSTFSGDHECFKKIEKQELTYVVVSPGSVWKTKRWNEDYFRDLVELLTERYPNLTVLISGAPNEFTICEHVKGRSNAVNLAGKLSLAETSLLISLARGLICNDSAPLHIASAFKIPAVVLYCATSPEFGFGPWQNSHCILQSESLSCKPCMAHGSNRCPTGTERCRTDIKPVYVLEALNKLCSL